MRSRATVAAAAGGGLLLGLLVGQLPVVIGAAALIGALALARSGGGRVRRRRGAARRIKRITKELDRLSPAGFRCLHDVRTGHGVIDHVAVGPTGVFAIAAKAWTHHVWVAARPRRLRVGYRDETPALGQLTRRAMEIQERLGEPGGGPGVQAVVAVTATRLTRGPIELDGVAIVDVHQIARFLTRRPALLGPHEVGRLSNAIPREGERILARSSWAD